MTWKLLYPIAPALVLAGLTFIALGIFAVRVKLWGYPDLPDADRRGTTAIATPFIQRFLFWCVTPLERGLARLDISPNSITIASLVVCGVSGGLSSTKHFAAAAWCYIFAGLLDILDGRVARRRHTPPERSWSYPARRPASRYATPASPPPP